MIIASISPPPTAKYPGACCVTPREARLATPASPLITTVMMSAIATTTTSTSSSPTAVPLIVLTTRVEAIASRAWIRRTTSVIRRAVPSSGARPTSGMNAWLASALSTATTAIARYQKVSQPKPRPIFGLARRDAHWYEEPLSGMRAANCAITSATRTCPATATGHNQIPTGPASWSTWWYVAKMPTATEMKANEIANTWKEPSVRFSSWW
jgi:hypothetical protein